MCPQVKVDAERRQPSPAAACDTGLDVVTGAFGYSGRAIAAQLLRAGRQVRTVTGHPKRGRDQHAIEVAPLDFDDPRALAATLRGRPRCTTPIGSLRPRRDRPRPSGGEFPHPISRRSPSRGAQGGPRLDPAPFGRLALSVFRGKGAGRAGPCKVGVPHAVLRPSVLFDERGVLLNNIAWLLRHLPVFGVGGDGRYRVRPIMGRLGRPPLEAATWPGDRSNRCRRARPSQLRRAGRRRFAAQSVAAHALFMSPPPRC